jgi:hypothetical protein
VPFAAAYVISLLTAGGIVLAAIVRLRSAANAIFAYPTGLTGLFLVAALLLGCCGIASALTRRWTPFTRAAAKVGAIALAIAGILGVFDLRPVVRLDDDHVALRSRWDVRFTERKYYELRSIRSLDSGALAIGLERDGVWSTSVDTVLDNDATIAELARRASLTVRRAE